MHIYRGRQLYWWMKPEYPEKTTDLPQVTENFISCSAVSSRSRMIWIQTHNFSMIGTACTCSCKSNNYHTITTSTNPTWVMCVNCCFGIYLLYNELSGTPHFVFPICWIQLSVRTTISDHLCLAFYILSYTFRMILWDLIPRHICQHQQPDKRTIFHHIKGTTI